MPRPKKKDKKTLTSFFRTVGVRKLSWIEAQKHDKELKQLPVVVKYYNYLNNQVKNKTSIVQIARNLGVKEETVKGHLDYLGIEPLPTSEAIKSGLKRRRIKKGIFVPVKTKKSKLGEEHYIPTEADIQRVKPTPIEQKLRKERAEAILKSIEEKKKKKKK
jgi:hypothetical protein